MIAGTTVADLMRKHMSSAEASLILSRPKLVPVQRFPLSSRSVAAPSAGAQRAGVRGAWRSAG